MDLAKSDRGWMFGSAGDDVVTIGDPRLKAGADYVADPREVMELIDRMTNRLRTLNGAGLAAPQIGATAQVIVVEVRKTDVFPDRPTSPLVQMVNPVIVEHSPRSELGWEGCFSVPGFMGVVSRPAAITVEFTTPDCLDRVERFEGYIARVIQHEVDHLHGVEFVQRMTSMDTFTTVQNYLAFHRG